MNDAAVATIEVPLKAPFPAFGGKSRIADLTWERLGGDGPNAARNSIEPFCFSAAWTLKRPGGAGAIETINDLNAFVANFWRAVRADPDAVAHHADWPVNETDLHARHRWLVGSAQAAAKLQAVRDDPDAFDAKIAGWWCWGACCWIGSGWCDETVGLWLQTPRLGDTGQGVAAMSEQVPTLAGDGGAHGRGVNASAGPSRKRAKLSGNGVGNGVHANPSPHDRRPGLAQDGWGINAAGSAVVPGAAAPALADLHQKRPVMSNDGSAFGKGVHGFMGETSRPQLADQFARGRGVNGNDAASVCDARSNWIRDWMRRLADRLRPVRVCCGHWDRVCDSPSTMTRLGTTAVFLDPPYRKHLACGKKNRTAHIYANDKVQDVGMLCDEVQAWCLKWGPDPDVRIALCGLEGEYPEIERAGWEVLAWKSNGGYGNQGGGGLANENAARERVWFSPGCLAAGGEVKGGLFA